jgi:hypothetical protein
VRDGVCWFGGESDAVGTVHILRRDSFVTCTLRPLAWCSVYGPRRESDRVALAAAGARAGLALCKVK